MDPTERPSQKFHRCYGGQHVGVDFANNTCDGVIHWLYRVIRVTCMVCSCRLFDHH